jgi:hypothetical protein
VPPASAIQGGVEFERDQVVPVDEGNGKPIPVPDRVKSLG